MSPKLPISAFHGRRAAVIGLGRLADDDAAEPRMGMLCRSVRLGIIATLSCASAGPSAMRRRAGAEGRDAVPVYLSGGLQLSGPRALFPE